MNCTLQQLQQVEIEQILALHPSVPLEAAKQLHLRKMKLVSRLNQERLVYHASNRSGWFSRLVKRLKTQRIQS